MFQRTTDIFNWIVVWGFRRGWPPTDPMLLKKVQYVNLQVQYANRQLITFAKILINSNEIKIVFVSSEGAIIPMLQMLFEVNRAVAYEVVDAPDDKRGLFNQQWCCSR